MSDPKGTRMPSDIDFIRARSRAMGYNIAAELLMPPTEEVAGRIAGGTLARDLAAAAEGLALAEAAAPLVAALRGLGAASMAALDERFMRVFGATPGSVHPPYSTDYDPDGGFRKEQELGDIAGFYRAFGIGLADDVHERVDHFGVEADFLAFLALKEAFAMLEDGPARVEQVRSAAGRFAAQYVAPAVSAFVERLETAGADELWLQAARWLAAVLAERDGDPARVGRRIVALPVVPA